ncbi:MAG: GGDEF domain-containing protein [Pseudomonadota bacterium]
MEDALTGLPNRRRFECRMDRRDWTNVHLLMIDVDRFKRINDCHSHQVGDEVLKRIAAVLRAGVRSTDFAARLAGDEFVVALFDLDDAAAQATAARLKLAVSAQAWGDIAPSLNVSISVGVTRGEADSKFAEVLRQSDAAMYRDKATHASQRATIDVAKG